jgi:hypothetical protein
VSLPLFQRRAEANLSRKPDFSDQSDKKATAGVFSNERMEWLMWDRADCDPGTIRVKLAVGRRDAGGPKPPAVGRRIH